MSKISDLSDGGVIQGGDTLIAVRSGGNVKVTYGGSTTANIDGGTIDGTTIGGTTPAAGNFTTGSFTGDVSFGDNDKAIFGAGSDLQIYHDSNNSYIVDSGTGNLYINANELRIGNADNSKDYIHGNNGAEVKLYYNNAQKLATTSTGIDVTGTVTADGVNTDYTNGFKIFDGSELEASWTHVNTSGTSTLNVGRNATWGGELIIQTDTKNRANFASNGDISFYEDTGTSPKMVWKSADERLGVGNASPTRDLTVGDTAVSSYINIKSSATNGFSGLAFGDSDDDNRAQIVFDNSTDKLQIQNGGGGVLDNRGITLDSSENVGIGTDSPNVYGKTAIKGGEAGTANSNLSLLTNGDAQGEVANLAFYGTFIGTADNGPRRTADITAGFNAGSWGSEYLSFNVGKSGASNDTRSLTNERMRISSDGLIQAVSSITSDPTNTNAYFYNKSGVGPTLSGYRLSVRTGATPDESLRVDESGNLLVGDTNTAPGTGNTVAGVAIRGGSDNRSFFSVSSNYVAAFNRSSNEGSVVEFNKDGTNIGSITIENSTLQIGTNNTNLAFSDANDAFYVVNAAGEGRDNSHDLGKSDVRFNDIYATNGTIQTSDRNEKQDIEALSDAEQRVAVAAKGLLRKFRWIDSVEEKGDEARIHFGIIAQDLQDAFTAEGLDAGRYGMFINSTWTDEETGEERSRMGVRYSELLAFIISAI